MGAVGERPAAATVRRGLVAAAFPGGAAEVGTDCSICLEKFVPALEPEPEPEPESEPEPELEPEPEPEGQSRKAWLRSRKFSKSCGTQFIRKVEVDSLMAEEGLSQEEASARLLPQWQEEECAAGEADSSGSDYEVMGTGDGAVSPLLPSCPGTSGGWETSFELCVWDDAAAPDDAAGARDDDDWAAGVHASPAAEDAGSAGNDGRRRRSNQRGPERRLHR